MYLNISRGRVYFEDQYISIVDWHDDDEFLFLFYITILSIYLYIIIWNPKMKSIKKSSWILIVCDFDTLNSFMI